MPLGPDGKLDRSNSAQLFIPANAKPEYVTVTVCLRDQFGVNAVKGVQQWGYGRFQIQFSSHVFLSKAVESGFKFQNEIHDIEPLNVPFRWILVKNAPFELELEDFVQYLSPYGKVVRMDFVYPDEIKPWHNGDRKIKFIMNKDVPNFLNIGIYRVQFYYAGVVKLCRRCNGSDHFARDCRSSACRKCGQVGHTAATCVQRDQANAPLQEEMPPNVVPDINQQSPVGKATVQRTSTPITHPESAGSTKKAWVPPAFEGSWADQIPDELGFPEGFPPLEGADSRQDSLLNERRMGMGNGTSQLPPIPGASKDTEVYCLAPTMPTYKKTDSYSKTTPVDIQKKILSTEATSKKSPSSSGTITKYRSVSRPSANPFSGTSLRRSPSSSSGQRADSGANKTTSQKHSSAHDSRSRSQKKRNAKGKQVNLGNTDKKAECNLSLSSDSSDPHTSEKQFKSGNDSANGRKVISDRDKLTDKKDCTNKIPSKDHDKGEGLIVKAMNYLNGK